MKTATVPCRGLLTHGLSFLAALIGASSLLITTTATAESVDSELLLLVDVSSPGLGKGEFDSLMSGYASALTSSAVIQSIESGATKRIAIQLSFYGVTDAASSVGVAWMSIGSLGEAQAFANKIVSLSEPKGGTYSYQDALLQGLLSIGTETGGPDNGFQSAIQIIEVAGSSKLKGDVAGATAAALAQGVDMIGGIVIGKNADKLETFYADNVIGGSVGGVTPTIGNNPIDAGISGVLSGQLGQAVAGGAVATVPEPSAALMVISSLGVFLLFARRRTA